VRKKKAKRPVPKAMSKVEQAAAHAIALMKKIETSGIQVELKNKYIPIVIDIRIKGSK